MECKDERKCYLPEGDKVRTREEFEREIVEAGIKEVEMKFLKIGTNGGTDPCVN
jgi:hypothetical protein